MTYLTVAAVYNFLTRLLDSQLLPSPWIINNFPLLSLSNHERSWKTSGRLVRIWDREPDLQYTKQEWEFRGKSQENKLRILPGPRYLIYLAGHQITPFEWIISCTNTRDVSSSSKEGSKEKIWYFPRLHNSDTNSFYFLFIFVSRVSASKGISRHKMMETAEVCLGIYNRLQTAETQDTVSTRGCH